MGCTASKTDGRLNAQCQTPQTAWECAQQQMLALRDWFAGQLKTLSQEWESAQLHKLAESSAYMALTRECARLCDSSAKNAEKCLTSRNVLNPMKQVSRSTSQRQTDEQFQAARLKIVAGFQDVIRFITQAPLSKSQRNALKIANQFARNANCTADELKRAKPVTLTLSNSVSAKLEVSNLNSDELSGNGQQSPQQMISDKKIPLGPKQPSCVAILHTENDQPNQAAEALKTTPESLPDGKTIQVTMNENEYASFQAWKQFMQRLILQVQQQPKKTPEEAPHDLPNGQSSQLTQNEALPEQNAEQSTLEPSECREQTEAVAANPPPPDEAAKNKPFELGLSIVKNLQSNQLQHSAEPLEPEPVAQAQEQSSETENVVQDAAIGSEMTTACRAE